MKAVMYGGGNIGRGFIGALFSRSGYQVTFIDVMKPVVDALNERHTYPVRILNGESSRDEWIKNVDAVNGTDADAVATCIAETDLMATAVGVNILPRIAPLVAEGLRRRFAQSNRPLNIIICENLNDANVIFAGMIREHLSEEERRLFDERVGMVEASIGRMVPVMTEEMKDGDALRVCVEPYGFLPVDRDGFRGEIPKVDGMIPFSPFDFYVKRKLFLHNMGHACCAYLGALSGYQYIAEAAADPSLRLIVQNAMEASALALAKKYDQPSTSLFNHMYDLLLRFNNAALGDTCDRVGRDPARKLALDDRLVGAWRLCEETGVDGTFIAIGIAGALHRYLDETGCEQNKESAITELTELAGCRIDAAIRFYERLLAGARPAELYAAAERERRATLGQIV